MRHFTGGYAGDEASGYQKGRLQATLFFGPLGYRYYMRICVPFSVILWDFQNLGKTPEIRELYTSEVPVFLVFCTKVVSVIGI